jgi:hypothetical protein
MTDAEAAAETEEEQLNRLAEENAEAVRRARDAVANAKRVRSEQDARDRSDTSGLLRDIMALASKATGLSSDELAQEAERITVHERVELPPIDPRASGRRRMRAAGVPERFIRHVNDVDARECEALQVVREFMADPSKWCLVLAGGPGTCKTGSACWALSQVEGGQYVESVDLIAVAIEDKPRWLNLRRAPLVVLDDVGTEGADSKGAYSRYLHALANGVYGDCRKLILPLNVEPQTFKAEYGERLADRIREGGRWRIVKGVSVRGTGKQGVEPHGQMLVCLETQG